MKNRFYKLLMTAILLFPFQAFSQQASEETPVKKEFYSLKEDRSFAHWSWGINVGGNIFDGDVQESCKKLIPTSKLCLTLGANVERTFNPIFGLGLEYMFIPYRADPPGNNKLKGDAHEVDVYLSINFLNLLYPEERGQQWGIFLNAGMGMSFYNAKMTNEETGEVVLDSKNNPMNITGGKSYVLPFALLVEYNITKDFAVGLKAEYRMHNKDNFEGHVVNIRQGNNNDGFMTGTLTFRHKLHLGKEAHTRNLSYGRPYIVEESVGTIEDLRRDIRKLDVEYRDEVKPRIENMEQQVSKIFVMEKQVSKIPEMEEQIVIISETTERMIDLDLKEIEFSLASDVIKPEYYSSIDKVAEVMRENPSYQLEIIGHTDVTGNKEYNTALSEKRANSVRNYLINKGIQGNRISALGRNYFHPVATNQTEEGRKMNRRVEFIVKDNGKVIYTTAKF
jgi:OOP family OmpA-OmpF porin